MCSNLESACCKIYAKYAKEIGFKLKSVYFIFIFAMDIKAISKTHLLRPLLAQTDRETPSPHIIKDCCKRSF